MSAARQHRAASRLRAQAGFALTEMLVAMVITVIIATAMVELFASASHGEARNQAFAQSITATQNEFATLLHDLRGAVAIQSVGPGVLDFQMLSGGTYYNVQYDCSAADSLGAPYTRCARTQAVAPAQPPQASATAHDYDIQHVYNNPTNGFNTFCNPLGTAPSGSVFFASNSTLPNTDGSGLACDESYLDHVVSPAPNYIQIRLQVPAGGDLSQGGLKHFFTLQDGVFLPNPDVGS